MIVLDQITKQAALAWLPLHQIVEVMPGFDWYLTYNTGAAFSFLRRCRGVATLVFHNYDDHYQRGHSVLDQTSTCQ